MSFPNLQADPAKLVVASAGHVYASVVLFDGLAAHGALLHDEAVDPLVLPAADHAVPAPQVHAVQRPVGLRPAETAHLCPAVAERC